MYSPNLSRTYPLVTGGAFALEDKYQYNQKELNNDFGLLWNDYGARWYNPQLGIWNQIDPLAEKYAAWSGYNYVGDNPIKMIDPDGRYQLPAAFIKNYPTISSYIQNNIKDDVLGSSIIMTAFLNNTAADSPDGLGNLNTMEVTTAVTWNSGPTIIARDDPGGMLSANGYYSSTSKQIELNTEHLDKLERILSDKNISPEDKLAALLPVYMTILHETVHYGDYLDGLRQDGREPGNRFEQDVWGVRIVDEDTMIIVPRFIDQGEKYDNVESIKQMINEFLNTNEEKETLPSIPEQ